MTKFSDLKVSFFILFFSRNLEDVDMFTFDFTRTMGEKRSMNDLFQIVEELKNGHVVSVLYRNPMEVAIIDNLEGYCSIYDDSGVFLGNLELNETVNFSNSLTLLEIISSTGLQIKTDLGIPIIYGGFFLLMLSTLISYITYSQIWIVEKQKQLFIGGTTNRAIFDFELEFFKFIQ